MRYTVQSMRPVEFITESKRMIEQLTKLRVKADAPCVERAVSILSQPSWCIACSIQLARMLHCFHEAQL